MKWFKSKKTAELEARIWGLEKALHEAGIFYSTSAENGDGPSPIKCWSPLFPHVVKQISALVGYLKLEEIYVPGSPGVPATPGKIEFAKKKKG